MASSPSPRSKNSLEDTLLYFSEYGFPLTSDELWFWQHGTRISKFKILNFNSNFKLQISNFKTRKQRELVSKQKWVIAKRVGKSLQKIPFLQAIFVTGSLAMNNADETADIDLMVITSPNTLWLTRLWVYLTIHSLRRKPQTTHAPNLVCDNLYLDTNNLIVHEHSIYTAHEILQAKCIFDRGGVHRQFLLSNSWVKKFLPVAYKYLTLGPSPEFRRGKPQQGEVFWKMINLIFFVIQYLYMRPKMTTERVNLGYAFFHPHSSVPTSS